MNVYVKLISQDGRYMIVEYYGVRYRVEAKYVYAFDGSWIVANHHLIESNRVR